jgi:hypothetical protein
MLIQGLQPLPFTNLSQLMRREKNQQKQKLHGKPNLSCGGDVRHREEA